MKYKRPGIRILVIDLEYLADLNVWTHCWVSTGLWILLGQRDKHCRDGVGWGKADGQAALKRTAKFDIVLVVSAAVKIASEQIGLGNLLESSLRRISQTAV